MIAKPEEKIPCPTNLLEGESEDQPIVEVPENPEPMTMHDRGNRGHDAGEHLRSRRQAKTERAELVNRPLYAKSQEPARRWMNRNLEVGVLKIQGHHPIPHTKRLENGLCSLHMKMGDIHKPVEAREVNHRAPPTSDLGSHKERAVNTWCRRSRLDSLLDHQVGHRIGKSQPTDGRRAVTRKGQRSQRERRKGVKRDLIPEAQDLHHSSICPPRVPSLPTTRQTSPYHAGRGT